MVSVPPVVGVSVSVIVFVIDLWRSYRSDGAIERGGACEELSL